MHSENIRHGAETIVGGKVWGNKLCIPNQITLDPRPDDRSLLTRLEDGARAILGRPRRLPRETESYPPPPELQHTIRTYIKKGARLVAMLRDPDHVVDSIRRRGNVSVEQGKHRWVRAIRDIKQVHEEYGNRTCLVRFVDLVNEPELVMRKVCGVLELSYSPRMAEGYKYTPQYDHDHLDPSVATREVPSYDLETFDPEVYEMYLHLEQHAKLGAKERSDR